MEHISGDRRQSNSQTSFPFVDNKGNEVMRDRRSGFDRRNTKRDSDVATSILNILH